MSEVPLYTGPERVIRYKVQFPHRKIRVWGSELQARERERGVLGPDAHASEAP